VRQEKMKRLVGDSDGDADEELKRTTPR